MAEHGATSEGAPARVALPSVVVGLAPRVALTAGLGVALVLAIAGLLPRIAWYAGGSPLGLYGLLDVDSERSIPAWFSSLLLAACAGSLWTVGAMQRQTARRASRPWWLLAVVFLYMSLDESLAIHEGATEPIREALGLGGALYYAWVLVAVPLVALLTVVLVPFLRRLPRRTLVGFIVAGVVFVSGAVGMEMLAGLLGARGEQGSMLWHVLVTLEEFGEMAGASLLLASVNEHRQRHVGRLSGAQVVQPGA